AQDSTSRASMGCSPRIASVVSRISSVEAQVHFPHWPIAERTMAMEQSKKSRVVSPRPEWFLRPAIPNQFD
ncbi:MAG: hypothetical protein OXH69_26030, partial [Acidobacteria bacterium]|nr:hypothetical protein [Acidobacteriota bacterium]